MPFISIEGIDGSGKSTQVEILSSTLKERGLDVLKTKEPDGGWIGKEIRSILVQHRCTPLTPQEEMLLVSAARCDHVQSIIKPAIEAGTWVVTDRFVDSTFAFQVFETGVSEATFDAIKAETIGETMPDFTFILDIDEETAHCRRSIRDGGERSDPTETTRKFKRIRNGLLESANREPERCHVIDATSSIHEVAGKIMTIIERLSNGPSGH